MAITVTPDMTDISLCESNTSWSAGSADSDMKIQGSYCLAEQVKNTTSATISYTLASAANMTDKFIYFWAACNGLTDTKANGGFRLYVETDASNFGYWYVGGGADNFGWNLFVVDPSTTPDTGTGTVNVASIAKVGIQFKTLTTVVGLANNVFWDAFRYGTGLTITSAAGDDIDFDDIYNVDDSSTYKYGILQKRDGVFHLNGMLTFGDTGTGTVDFIDKSQVVIANEQTLIPTTAIGIYITGNSTGNTSFIIGEAVGSYGAAGCVFKSAGANKFKFDVLQSSTVNTCSIYGSTFLDCAAMNLYRGNFVSNTLEACGELITNGATTKYCTFIRSDNRALRYQSSSFSIDNCTFYYCPRALHIDYTWRTYLVGMYFIGGDGTTIYDLEHSTAGAHLISNDIDSNAFYVIETGGGSTSINNATTLKVTVVDEDGALLSGARVGVYKTSDDTEVLSGTTYSSGYVRDTNYDYTADTECYYRVRRSSTGTTRYYPLTGITTIVREGFDVKVTLIEDDLVGT